MVENILCIVNNEVDGMLCDVLSLFVNIVLVSIFWCGGEEERNELGSVFDCIERV